MKDNRSEKLIDEVLEEARNIKYTDIENVGKDLPKEIEHER